MQLSRLRRPVLAHDLGSIRPDRSCRNGSIIELFARLSVLDTNAAVEGRRHATVRAQGAYKQRSNKSIAKKMGAKRIGDQYVIPGNIIYKQRGTIWHAGENAILGRDFTIHAGVAGYVKYYRDPEVHPTRQFIGVALQRTDSLPYPKDQPRQRKLAKIAVPRREPNVLPALSASNLPTMVSLPPDGVKFVTAADATVATDAAGNPLTASDKKARTQKLPPQTALAPRQLYLRDDYSYRESNWQLGRIAGEVGKQIGGRRGFSRSAVYRTKKKKKSVKIQRVRETAAERRKGFEAAAKKEKARKAQVEAQAVEDMKRSEERFAEMEAAEAAGQLPASKEEEIRP